MGNILKNSKKHFTESFEENIFTHSLSYNGFLNRNKRIFTGNNSIPVSVPIGIYLQDEFTNTWVDAGGNSHTASAIDLDIVNAGSLDLNGTTYDTSYYGGRYTFKQTYRTKINSLGLNDTGIGPFVTFFGAIFFTGDAIGTQGKITLYKFPYAGFSGSVISSGTVPLVVGDEYDIILERDIYTFTATVTKVIGGSTQSCTHTWASTIEINSSLTNYGINCLGGDFTITKRTFETTEMTKADFVLVSDSKASFLFPFNQSDTFYNIYSALYPTDKFYINGGPNDTLQGALLQLPELLQYEAKKYIFNLGCNDIRFGRTLLQVHNDMATIYNTLTAIGSTVYFMLSAAEKAPSTIVAQILTLNAQIITDYPTSYIDNFTPSEDPGSPGSLNPIYSYDGIHWNGLYNSAVLAPLIKSFI